MWAKLRFHGRRRVEDALAVRPAELDWTLSRTDHEDPDTQERAAARLTLVARDPDEKKVGRALSGAAVEMALATYPGCFLTAPPSGGTAYGVFKPGYVDQGVPRHTAVLDDGSTVRIPARVPMRSVSAAAATSVTR